MVASKLTGAAAFAALISLTAAQAPVWGQCGGIGFTGPTSCAAGSVCTYSNDYYSQCIPGTGGGTTTTTTRTTTRTTTTSSRTTTTSPRTSTTTTTTSRTTTGGGTSPTGLIGYGAGTTGGGNASPITVTSCDALKTALNNNNPKVVRISGVLSGCGAISVGSNTSLLGATSNSGITNGRFSVSSKTNVIIRNLVLGPAPLGDDIVTIIASTKVWIDHNTFKSVGIVGDKDDYDGLLDFTQGSDYCTVSWNKFQDHWKTSLTGSADTTGSTDRGKFHITWHNNWYENVFSRAPLGRWTTSHIFNNYYHKMQTAVNVRIESNIRVENCYFEEIASETVWGSTEGAGCESGSYFVDAPTPNIAKQCTHNPPYSYTLAAGSAVKSIVTAGAGHGKISV